MAIVAKHKTSTNKTEQLLLYVCDRLKNEASFGATKLNKVLYYIDTASFIETGRPISDFAYIKQDHGVTPEPSHFLPLKEKLLDEHKVNFYGFPLKKPVAKFKPDIEVFTSKEIELISQVIELFEDANASLLSDINHQELAYILARPMEKIPLYACLLTYKVPSAKDISWAKKKVMEYESKKSKHAKTVQRNRAK